MKKILYEKLRKYTAYKITGEKGKCEFDKDKIICYVNSKKLKNNIKGNKYQGANNNLFFQAIMPNDKNILNKYKIGTNVTYIIQNVEFDKEISIYASLLDCHIIFKNCTFKDCIKIEQANSVTFINNIYMPAENRTNYLLKKDDFHISVRNKNSVKTLKFINDDLKLENGRLYLWLSGQNIELTNTNINAANIEIKSDNLQIISSNITSQSVSIKSNNIEYRQSQIQSDVLNIDMKENTELENVCANTVTVNSIKSNSKINGKIDFEKIELQKQRIKLIECIKKVKTTCNSDINNMLVSIKQEMQNKSLKRILKK